LKTVYGYADVISGFFEFPTENARRILPHHLQPAELHHGTSIFSMTCFDFDKSSVGPYGEVVMSVVVAPIVKPGERLPKFALYPYMVGTTTRAAREHAIERWHLPHWMEDVGIEWVRAERSLGAKVTLDGTPLAELTIGEHSWQPVEQLYQSFMKDDSGAYQANIVMEGEQSEHEEETGRLVLHEHPFNRALQIGDVAEAPFREIWMRRGIQTFDPLLTLQTA
jgi:hypothetical protein